MAIVNVFFNTTAHYVGIFFQQTCVFFAHFGGNFVSNMNQLAKVWIIISMAGNMAQSVGKFFAIPVVYFFRRWQQRIININHIGVRSAQLFFSGQRFYIYFFGNFQSLFTFNLTQVPSEATSILNHP